MTDNTVLAAEQVAGLRAIADMIEQNPELATHFDFSLNTAGIGVHLRDEDRAAEMARISRIARRYGATSTKEISEKFHNMTLDFGGAKAEVIAYREEVCERVVVGTREVTEEVPDPEALKAVPMVTVTRTEHVTKWECKPILAAADDSAALAGTAAAS
jgi:hypothetical protein